VMVQ